MTEVNTNLAGENAAMRAALREAVDALYFAASHIRGDAARHSALSVHDKLAYGNGPCQVAGPRGAHFRDLAQRIEHLKLVENWLDRHGDLPGALGHKNLARQVRESLCDYCDAIKPEKD